MCSNHSKWVAFFEVSYATGKPLSASWGMVGFVMRMFDLCRVCGCELADAVRPASPSRRPLRQLRHRPRRRPRCRVDATLCPIASSVLQLRSGRLDHRHPRPDRQSRRYQGPEYAGPENRPRHRRYHRQRNDHPPVAAKTRRVLNPHLSDAGLADRPCRLGPPAHPTLRQDQRRHCRRQTIAPRP